MRGHMAVWESVELGLHVVLGVGGVATVLVVSLLFLYGLWTAPPKPPERRPKELIPEFSSCNAKCSDRRYLPFEEPGPTFNALFFGCTHCILCL